MSDKFNWFYSHQEIRNSTNFQYLYMIKRFIFNLNEWIFKINKNN